MELQQPIHRLLAMVVQELQLVQVLGLGLMQAAVAAAQMLELLVQVVAEAAALA